MDILEGRCDRKVVGGKLFRIKVLLELEGQKCSIRRLTILGDFFMHPEEAIEGLEETIRKAFNGGQDLSISVTMYLNANGATLYGGSPIDLSSAVTDAVDDAMTHVKGA